MSTFLNESHMPGPTVDAKTLQLAQYEASDAMYSALNEVRCAQPDLPRDVVYVHPRYVEKLTAYEATVNALVALLGADAHCCQVDCVLWSEFSDFHKDTYGFRPRRGMFTRADVRRRLDTAH